MQQTAAVSTAPDLSQPFRVGDWSVDASANQIWRQDRSVKLQPKVMDLLVFFSMNQQRPVSRQELIDSVWSGMIISDDAVTNAIVKLRRALDDGTGEVQYIQTIPKAGYRLIAPISSLATGADGEVIDMQDFGWTGATPDQAPGRRQKWRLAAVSIVAAASVGAILISTIASFMVPTRSSATYSQVSDLPGREAMPAISPDGQRLAMVWTADRTKDFQESDIYVMSLETGDLVQLTNNTDRDTNPVWSPDGETIAFVRFSGMQCGIYLIPAYGAGAERFLHQCGVGPMRLAYSVIDWSSDGRWITYVDSGEDNLLFHISLYSTETGETRQVTRPSGEILGDLSPVFSPLSDKIAFTRFMPSGTQELFVVDLDSSELKQLTDAQTRLQGLSWSDDGKSILYLPGRRDSADLWRVDLDGSKPIRVIGAAQGLSDLRRADDGQFYAAILRTDKVEAKLLPLDGETGDTAIAIDNHSSDVSAPKISPDGKRIGYVARRMGRYELRISDVGNSASSKIFDIGDSPAFFSFSWSQSGEKLAISQGKDGTTNLYIVDAASGQADMISSSNFSDFTPMLYSNGEDVIYSSRRDGNWQLRRLSLVDQSDRLLVRSGGFYPQESLDGKWIYYYRYDNPGGIWRTSLEGDSTTLVMREPYSLKRWFHWQNWSLAENGIHIVTPDKNGAQLAFYDFNNGDLSPQRSLPVNRTNSLSISADQNFLAYTPAAQTESDIIRLTIADE